MKLFIAVMLLAIAGAANASPSIDDIDPPKSKVAPIDNPNCNSQWCSPFWKSMPKEEYFFYAAEAADMMTTLDIKNHPNLQEENPILGHHPSDAMVISMCSVAALIHSSITYVMVDNGVNPKVIKAWEYVSIGVESGFAVHNLRLGLRFTY